MSDTVPNGARREGSDARAGGERLTPATVLPAVPPEEWIEKMADAMGGLTIKLGEATTFDVIARAAYAALREEMEK